MPHALQRASLTFAPATITDSAIPVPGVTSGGSATTARMRGRSIKLGDANSGVSKHALGSSSAHAAAASVRRSVRRDHGVTYIAVRPADLAAKARADRARELTVHGRCAVLAPAQARQVGEVAIVQ